MASGLIQCIGAAGVSSAAPSTSAASSSVPLNRPVVSFSGRRFSCPSTAFAARPVPSHACQALPDSPAKVSSIVCQNCDGNGVVVCSQCQGDGINSQDFFDGRFKAGTICWLCKGKRHMLCGECNGAGFLGGFMNTQDD